MNSNVNIISSDHQNDDAEVFDQQPVEVAAPAVRARREVYPLDGCLHIYLRNDEFHRALSRDFRVFPDEDVYEENCLMENYLTTRHRHEVVGLTTSSLAQIVRAPTISWKLKRLISSEDINLAYDHARAYFDGQRIPFSVWAKRASLRGLPFVSVYGVPYVDNLEDGESGYHRESNLHVGRRYSARIAEDPRLGPFVSARRKFVHTNLLCAVANGLGWCTEFTTAFFTLVARALIDVHLFIRDGDNWDDRTRYVVEDLQTLQYVLYEYRTKPENSFIGDLFVAQALGRWLKIAFDIDIFIITPMGCASSVLTMHDNVVILSFEPTSRMWSVWCRRNAPYMDFENFETMTFRVTIQEWECLVRSWPRTPDKCLGDDEISKWRQYNGYKYSCPAYDWTQVFISPDSGRWVAWMAVQFPLLESEFPDIDQEHYGVLEEIQFPGMFKRICVNVNVV
jgi:hypothetical protein